ncbi:1-(5-phosphoribosyl)-5-[(5-phosphoribosylamino)methylideneamino]imidazole-4-carboxamide isomerase [Campylobacter sp. VicNov18]|uniref:1-(5-phosphoribosyl)-5-[(5- phosphoribosylamino)methylideneamino]imidazole-4- carboxamide isomerase n=1 Tax=Campylobacter bilis TaxID=2691918 RepID=UPI00130EDB9A|nr:1-(5-phosphoribosyl)-5-[(5-phosphoribosylamino)methylideneamino]imidazole-4-carboxamide isomerase [Campylobacter bilis]MPV63786.1 1-(5-phosphoribosyl)-5-[(5-phosphoribosylamino)methylideneamino]imidazole-4-carboxamide isomerase [Campylobacter hepaticus]MBM0637287.1 1-(5-phosphoribosyl)-5-[(5-phosphoribosylamino)methylideneamino]imidazole-4-carboxamide isomerase [Campylobacter bilis]MCC8278006.1 1-(5-phosphoribosyl)-5-[(5-phosphoribosylamino)methylideneamino]imidazole-4-carboxamide isomerase [
MTTQIIPALDLIDGQVVRLIKGDYNQKKIYQYKALEKLQEYEKAGAKELHLVDLTGAKDPSKRQLNLIKQLSQEIKANLQVGGGIRTKEEIKSLLDCGVKRVVVGSITIKNPNLCIEILKEFGNEAIVFALDTILKDDYVIAINAWQETSDKKLMEVLDFYSAKGLKHILCTDISKDGTMQGPNIKLYKLIHEIFPHIHIQASGGIAKLEDLKKLKGICDKIIVGKALLDKVFSVEEGIKCLQNA